MSRRTGAIREALLGWYGAARRDLPWRRTRDPYAIWISETMLQQTRVETVIPYYERFLESFPTLQALATAEPDRVMGLWAGLGYYSRARNLQAAARLVVEELGGALPSDEEGLRRLPGVGRYTAGAVASIAFDRPAPVVDGNVTRVLSRLFGIREDVSRPAVAERIWEEAQQLARGPAPGDLNQALMELGATLCTPRAPRCGECPLRRRCRARRDGDAEALPVKQARARPRRVEGAAVLLARRDRWLAVRRPPGGLLGGLWGLPGGELRRGESPEAGLLRVLHESLGLAARDTVSLGTVRHLFTHRSLRLHVFRARAEPGRVRRSGFDAHRWVSRRGLLALPQGAVTRRALELAEASE